MTFGEFMDELKRLLASWPRSPESSDRYFDVKRLIDEYENQ